MIDTPETKAGETLNSADSVRFTSYKINNFISIVLYLSVFGDFVMKYVKKRWFNKNEVVPFETSVHTINIGNDNQFGNPEDNPELNTNDQESPGNNEHVR